MMHMFLHIYISNDFADSWGWIAASLVAVMAAGKGPWLAQCLQEWGHAYLANPQNLPTNVYGTWDVSLLVSDEDLAHEIILYLQNLGPYISTQDIVHFIDTPEMKTCPKLKQTISHKTACHWLKIMEYQWRKDPKGQYVDGHKQDNVVAY
ncbi:hypothetical protein BS47DRAFT_1360750 [Hydnum rufescens UP504]|uniref:Uncharacterized protein n=1 Tax=Hydnum rufescens UP504 TaxID=1448309 RepID=A0A9P6B1M4_9AGAM|nr:hypothetical protein BS47DRAFT_1360750 [Hydnum rufescens UP504]